MTLEASSVSEMSLISRYHSEHEKFEIPSFSKESDIAELKLPIRSFFPQWCGQYWYGLLVHLEIFLVVIVSYTLLQLAHFGNG